MAIIKLTQTSNYEKCQILRKAGFEVVREGYKFRLIDKQSNADQFIETTFSSINEILSVLAGYLLKVGYIVTV